MRLGFVLMMALITGGLSVAAGVWWSRGIDVHFFDYWGHTMLVACPTILFCVLFIVPWIQRWAQR